MSDYDKIILIFIGIGFVLGFCSAGAGLCLDFSLRGMGIGGLLGGGMLFIVVIMNWFEKRIRKRTDDGS